MFQCTLTRRINGTVLQHNFTVIFVPLHVSHGEMHPFRCHFGSYCARAPWSPVKCCTRVIKNIFSYINIICITASTEYVCRKSREASVTRMVTERPSLNGGHSSSSNRNNYNTRNGQTALPATPSDAGSEARAERADARACCRIDYDWNRDEQQGPDEHRWQGKDRWHGERDWRHSKGRYPGFHASLVKACLDCKGLTTEQHKSHFRHQLEVLICLRGRRGCNAQIDGLSLIFSLLKDVAWLTTE